jgi:hypothetical protein
VRPAPIRTPSRPKARINCRSLAAGVDLFTLSRRMGTSLAMIDATYGHFAPDADERERVLLDAYDNNNSAAEAAGGRMK